MKALLNFLFDSTTKEIISKLEILNKALNSNARTESEFYLNLLKTL